MDSKMISAMKNNKCLSDYIQDLYRRNQELPVFHNELSDELVEVEKLNIIYPVGDPIFIHLFGTKKKGLKYNVVEPVLNKKMSSKYDAVLGKLLNKAGFETQGVNKGKFEDELNKLLDETIRIGRSGSPDRKFRFLTLGQIDLTREEDYIIRYHLKRNIINSGILEPLIRDPYIEDISCVGLDNIYIVHKIFKTLETNIVFENLAESERYFRGLGERIGRPVSELHPIIDAALKDGSRLNLIFSHDVSIKGPSFTIRKFSEEPLSITQLIKWKTLSSEIAAYLWLCLENNISIFVCGETASGKTTTLNALLSFIPKLSKIISVEDTAEVKPPHNIWQQFLTRESHTVKNKIDMFDLLRTALRSRPDYIIVGEIRGAEGVVAFQAMQAGRPVMSTFHAASIQSMIRRFTGHPINVPVRFMDNLNIAIFQNALYQGSRVVRRITSVSEIIKYSEDYGGVLTRDVFVRDPVYDTQKFRGRNNSFILEDKISNALSYSDKRKIYTELDFRKEILDKLVEKKIYSNKELVKTLNDFQQKGFESLPFKDLISMKVN